MPVDFNHILVGRKVVYRASYPGAEPENGIVTSVNQEMGIVFVSYGRTAHGAATRAQDLTFLDGTPVARVMGARDE